MLAHARLASRSRASRALRWAAAPCGDSSAGAHCWPAGESRALNGALPQQHPPCSHALPAQTRVPPITTTTSTSGLARFSAIPDNNDIVPRSKNAVGTSPATQDEWTPVPHEQSGLVYYWNKRTGVMHWKACTYLSRPIDWAHGQ